ncbi:MAG: IclR family transcriptional regulator [Deltaproteobacteria bacterium]|nr:IclR family transcriptional regulator [Deltaproteobacteria bacterium]
MIQSVQRAMAILEHLGGEGHNTGITSVAQNVGLHKSTCFGLIHTLQQMGYAVQDEQGRYSLGLKAFELGSMYLNCLDFRAVAAPFLKDLAEKSKETVHLVLREGTHAVYIDKIEGPRSMNISSRIGQEVSFYCSGVGKAILAYMTKEEQEIIMGRPMIRHTKYTITTPEKLRKCIEKIRQNGYSYDDQEIEIGLCCLAVPLFGFDGKVVGGLSISGPDIRLTKKRKKELMPELINAMTRISQRLGYSGPKLGQ